MLSQRNGCLLLVCVIFISCLLPGVTFGQRIESVLFAYAKLYATTQTGAQYNLTGSVTFSQVSQTDSRINVTVNISGNLPPNTQYGLHIDQYGDISDLAGGNLGGSTYVGSGIMSTYYKLPASSKILIACSTGMPARYWQTRGRPWQLADEQQRRNLELSGYSVGPYLFVSVGRVFSCGHVCGTALST